MAAALLFNAMSANVAERAVELGTLQAAGLSRTTMTRIASAENLLLALPVGLVTGTIVARWFMSRYQNLGYRWTLEMRTSTYFIVTGGLLLAALATQLPLRRAIHHIDIARIARIVRERSI